MERVAVKSALIASIGYDAWTSSMEIEFRDGRVRRYFGVSASQHQRLMNSSSKGTYYKIAIQKADYPSVTLQAKEKE